jgi:hypothetical protein
MITSFIGGRSRRKPPTMGKQLVNFITCGCESSAPFRFVDIGEKFDYNRFNFLFIIKHMQIILVLA